MTWNNPNSTHKDFFEPLDQEKEQLSDRAMAEDTRSMHGQLKDAETALEYITAGNAYFTLRSKKTGTRYTFRVNKPKDDDNQKTYRPANLVERYFVALLSGPQNTDDYTYLGMIQDNVFRLTKASRMNMDSTPVKAFSWAFARLVQRELPEQLEIWHDGRCGRCGRKLTVPESVERGIGPECAGKMEAF